MLIYLASSFTMTEEVDWIANLLEAHGHHVIVRWWERRFPKEKFALLDSRVFYDHPECEYIFTRDRKGVEESDALIFVAENRVRRYSGANIELGIAIGKDIPCLSVGKLKRSILYFPVMRCDSIYEIIERLDLME